MKLNFRKGVKIAPGLRLNRRVSNLKKIQRHFNKMNELQKAKYEVDSYENFIAEICSLHKVCADFIDWKAIESIPAPYNKEEAGPKETGAERKALNYRPNIMDKLFRRVEKKREQLIQHIYKAKLEDDQEYNDWQRKVNLAQSINKGDPNAFLQAIEQMNIYEAISEYGNQFKSYVSGHTIAVNFNVQPSTFIPSNIKSLTSTGKLSIKEMGKTKFYALYQDYVCSCILRIARDMFAILPLSHVLIHAKSNQINSATGHMEDQTILSVRINRSVLNSFNFEQIDCSEAIQKFDHRMAFLKTSGFKPVIHIGD